MAKKIKLAAFALATTTAMSKTETPEEYDARIALIDSLRVSRDKEAEGLFEAIYSGDPSGIPRSAEVGSSAGPISASEVHVATPCDASLEKQPFEHVDRLRGKLLVLCRIDRPRPPRASGSAEEAGLQRRIKRVHKKRRLESRKEQADVNTVLRELQRRESMGEADFKQSKARSSASKKHSLPSQRQKLSKKLSTADVRKLATDTLLEQTHHLWVRYMQDVLRLNEPETVRSLSTTAEQHALAPSSLKAPMTIEGERLPVPDGIEDGSTCPLSMPSQLAHGAAGSLSKADWTGAAVYVADSTCADMRGIRGIVLVETEQTLVLGTPKWMDLTNDQLPSSKPAQSSKKKTYPLVRRKSIPCC